ncbi:MAG: hypothetical protein ACREL4_09310, partial [Gemmatimonadales bacterium]
PLTSILTVTYSTLPASDGAPMASADRSIKDRVIARLDSPVATAGVVGLDADADTASPEGSRGGGARGRDRAWEMRVPREVLEQQIEGYRRMTPGRKLEIAAGLRVFAMELKLAGLRLHHPDLSDDALRDRLSEFFGRAGA